jgi:hypothetical protein
MDVLRKWNSSLMQAIREHRDYLESIRLENQSRLEIIQNHHPKALDFFLD